MQRRIFILISAMTLLIGAAIQVGAIDLNRPGDGHDHEREEEHKKPKYTCPMHPEVVASHAGNCPKCGMKLVLVPEGRPSTHHSDKSRAGAEHAMHNHRSQMSNSPHEMHHHPPSHSGHEMQTEMKSSIDLADPMSREGSGTSWLPDSSPMYGKMFMFGENMLMLHGAIFPRYTNVSTRRGDDRIDAPNWFMGMYSHPIGDSTQIGARLMMSLDPLTKADAVIHCCFKAANRGTTSRSTIGNIRTISSTNSQSVSRKSSLTI
jgi:hypothetical protein